MPRVIYLGLQAFATEPQQLLPTAENPLACQSLVSESNPSLLEHQGELLVEHLDEEGLNILKAWLKEDMQRFITIAWPQPQSWLAASLLTGEAAEKALVSWQQQAKYLLALFRSARRQVALVGYVPGQALNTITAPESQPVLPPVYQLAAAQLISPQSALQEAYDYLKASSQEIQNDPLETIEIVISALGQHRDLQSAEQDNRRHQAQLQQVNTQRDTQQEELARLIGELTAARDEYALALQQLHGVQEALAGQTDKHKALQDEHKAQLNKHKTVLEQTEKQKTALEEKNSLLLGQLHGVQEALAGQTDKHKALQDEHKTLQNEHKAQLNKHKAVLEKTEKQKTALEEQNSLLLGQLHDVQEALEKKISDQNAVKEQHKRESGALKKALNTATQTQEESEQNNRKLLQTLQEVQQAYDELNGKKEALVKRKDMELEKQQGLADTQRENLQNLMNAKLEQQQQHLDDSINKLEQRLAQLHKTQEQLEKSHQNQAYLRQKVETRQKELNMLHASSQAHIQHLERLVQWLRVHAQRHIAAVYREIRSYKKTLPKQAAMLEASQFFDADWYLEQYPDVAKAGSKPAEHFIKFGALDGRDPGPLFSTSFYLTHYSDVAASGQHPLLHYLRHGIAEQRQTRPEQRHLPAPANAAIKENAQ